MRQLKTTSRSIASNKLNSFEVMWERSGNVKSDAQFDSRRTGNNLDLEEEEQRVLFDEQGRCSMNQ